MPEKSSAYYLISDEFLKPILPPGIAVNSDIPRVRFYFVFHIIPLGMSVNAWGVLQKLEIICLQLKLKIIYHMVLHLGVI